MISVPRAPRGRSTAVAARRGFSVVEMMIALVLLAVVVTKLTIVIGEARNTQSRESSHMILEDRARQVLDRISYAIMGSDAQSLIPDTEFPAHHSELRYRVSMGVEDGEVVWSDPEVIGVSEEDRNQIYWGRNVGEANERIVVWCNVVSELLEDEFANGIDDNENGLADEDGLTFVLDRSSVTIRITLRGEGDDGTPIRHTVETTVTCRN